MDQPLTLKQFEDGIATLKKNVKIDLTSTIEMHPVAFSLTIIAVVVAFSVWSTVFNDLLTKYILKRDPTLLEQAVVGLVLVVFIYWMVRKYQFSIANVE